VLFDCDGVLTGEIRSGFKETRLTTSDPSADSEKIVNELVAQMLTKLGWKMTGPEAHDLFLGSALSDMLVAVRTRIPSMPADFGERVQDAITELMRTSTEPIPGALESLRAFHERGIPMAVCSNSGREELHVKMRCLGIHEVFEGRIISYEDVERPKPYADMYLKGAREAFVARGHEGPLDAFLRRSIVVEDSIAGVKAGVAAGCHVVGLAGNQTREKLVESGAHSVIDHMLELQDLFL
jgi:HAD superfamily hydrolase (TIGR01509 family)